MRLSEQVVEQLERAYRSNAWHGPALLETLEAVDYSTASSHPVSGAHSIWELVIHLTGWKQIVRQRLTSAQPVLPSDAEDWPALPPLTPQNWVSTLERLERAHQQLVDTVRGLSFESLESTVPGKDYTALVMLLGVAQHDDYHGGQIALLKKAAR